MKLSSKEKKEYEAWLELRKRISTSTKREKKELSADKKKRISRLLKPSNFESFCAYYFPHYYKAKFGWFHREAARQIAENHNTFQVWEWAREHAKSVLANVFIPMWMLARGELDGMIIGSENELKAKVLLKDVEAELRNNESFKEDYNEKHVIGSWLSSYFSINDGIGFWSFGIGQNPAGVRNGEKRPNLGIVDDADSKKKYQKNSQRMQEDLDWILGEFLGCLQVKGKHFIYANNRVAKDGLTANMVGDVSDGDPVREGIKHIKVYATEDAKTHKMKMADEEGAKPAWPEFFTLEDIKNRIDEYGYRNAMRQFYHHHIEDGNIFKPDDIVWSDPLPLDKYDNLVTYVDPSFKDTKKNDFKAIVLLGQKGNYIDILWAWVRQDTVSNMVKAHYDLAEEIERGTSPQVYKTRSAIFKEVACRHYIEANFVQDLLLNDYQAEGDNRGYQLRLRKDTRKKPDKFGRIEDLEPLFARKLLRFNESLKKDKNMQTLKDQFLAFPNDHDDGPDAVEGGVFLLKRQGKRQRQQSRRGNFAKNQNRMA